MPVRIRLVALSKRMRLVYQVLKHPFVSPAILDSVCKETGEYLVYRFLAKDSLMGCTPDDVPDLQPGKGPKNLIVKAKASKGTTIKRTTVTQKKTIKTTRQQQEEKRLQNVKRQTKKIDCMSSTMSNCQAVVKPDCTKPKVVKAAGMTKAIISLLNICIFETPVKDNIQCEKELTSRNLVLLNKVSLPEEITNSVTLGTIEFAGVKFKLE